MEVNSSIPVLTPNNWNTWKRDTQVILMHYGCWQFIIKTERVDPDVGSTYKEKYDFQLRKDRTITLSYTNISPELKSLISDTTDGVVEGKILKDNFVPMIKSRIIQILDEMSGTKYQPGDDFGIFLCRVMTAVARLQESGHKVDDLYLGFQMIRYLSQEFQSTVQQIYRWKDEEFTAGNGEAELILEANPLQLMKQDLEKTETFFLSSASTSRKSSAVPAARMQFQEMQVVINGTRRGKRTVRRRTSSSICTDNTTSFKGANSDLKLLQSIISRPPEPLATYLTNEQETWKFMPPR
ncbi:hypothetical protein AVEN_171972-1 [Araneus ventricosus]|uniref:DUF4219 domain-containing protein n=1 Tax=Araneus ventricosus TaxID=182803 RepID=A0A4Y2T7N1_ARAVE|nr:hypothetical protein AVEN_55953-1 [Araneus ventricosus]GBN96638.1 hypothetical protein AVEN_171972-1 [Araneus ventricosus]